MTSPAILHSLQTLTPASTTRWIRSGDKIDLNGATPDFDYHLRVFAYTLDGRVIPACHFTTSHSPPHARTASVDPPALFRCTVTLEVEWKTELFGSMTAKSTLGFGPIVVENTHTALTFASSYSKSFDSGNSFRVDRARVKLELIHPKSARDPVLAGSVITACALDLLTLNDADFCDCAILPKDATDPIHVSRAILARTSPFFVTMFRGPWADAAKSHEHIAFGWSVAALLPCLIHMYCGWVLGQPLPEAELVRELCAKYKVDIAGFSVHQLIEVVDLARLFELKAMVKAGTKKMIRLLSLQLEEIE